MANPAPYYPQADEEQPAPDPAVPAEAVAEYLVDMIGQLETLSRLAGLDLLTYLLSMARSEAQTAARKPGS